MKKTLSWVVLISWMIPLTFILFLSINTYYRYPNLLPGGLTFKHYENLFFRNTLFYKGLFNSLIIGALTSIYATVLGYVTARTFVRHLRLPYVLTLILISIPLFIPSMPLFLGVHQMILRSPFSSSIVGIVLAHVLVSLPYTTNVFMNHLRGIPLEIEEVARTLGSSWQKVMTRVLLPMLRPAIGLSLGISFLISNTEYFSTFLVGGGNVVTLSMVMYPYITNNDYGLASSIGVVFMLGHVAMFALIDKVSKSNEDVKMLYIDG